MDLETIQKWLGTGSINIFGRPFAGKDTQGRILAEAFDARLLGGGDVLRNSQIPQHVEEALHRGELVPTKDYVEIVLPYLSREEFIGKPLILSSVGRWIGEEQGVMQVLNEANHSLKAVIYLDLPEEVVKNRWQALESHDDRGGRHDDTLEILEKRLAVFRDKTLPVIDEYRKFGLLEVIDGNQSPEKVSNDIISALTNRASASQ